jgi:glycosidase
LLGRCHAAGLRVLLDFVPNHVSRAYASDVMPDLSFGAADKKEVFFHRDNNFYYLDKSHPGGGAPLRLPTAGLPGCDGLFDGEREIGRVTGNNVVSWAPGDGDWYETIKLNYGHDFTASRDTSELPGADAALPVVPDTWRKMDRILAYWQAMGVDGFRVDMAHMVPMPFWAWAIRQARTRAPGVFFVAEAYDNDPAKLTDGNVLEALLGAGFDAVYDDATYDLVHEIFTGPKWANDLDSLADDKAGLFHRALRYAENHDEVRIANPGQWGGHGAAIGRAVSALLFCLGRGPIMVYHGQEVGEQAVGAEGYGKDDGRTTIFDYWSLPALRQWHDNGKCTGANLTREQRDLRAWYAGLLAATGKPAFTTGGFHALNRANAANPDFGRIPGEQAGGHWLYAFLRRDAKGGNAVMVVVNLHPSQVMDGVKIRVPAQAVDWLAAGDHMVHAVDLLNPATRVTAPMDALAGDGLALPALPPASAMLLEIRPDGATAR